MTLIKAVLKTSMQTLFNNNDAYVRLQKINQLYVILTRKHPNKSSEYNRVYCIVLLAAWSRNAVSNYNLEERGSNCIN